MTRKASEHHPREGDLPRDELIQQANELIANGLTVYIKFSCAYCGERCTLAEPNAIYVNGECFKCGKETEIDVGGFMVVSGDIAGRKENDDDKGNQTHSN